MIISHIYEYQPESILEFFWKLVFNDQPKDALCFTDFICSNNTSIGIYAVLFTIIIGIAFYVYGLEKEDQKWTLVENTEIYKTTKSAIFFFLISFINFTSTLYALFNFFLVLLLLGKMLKALSYIRDFNSSSISPKEKTEEFKLKKIEEELNRSQKEQALAEEINEEILKMNNVERFISDEKLEDYILVKATKSGYISGIAYSLLNSADIEAQKDSSFASKDKFYLPLNIYLGSKVEVDDTLYGEHKTNKTKISNPVSISDNYIDQPGYLNEELKTRFNRIFLEIQTGNYKLVEDEMSEMSKYIDLAFNKPDHYSENLLDSIKREILLPLQEASFDKQDLGVIRSVSAINLKYLYKSIDGGSKVKFGVFLTAFESAFWNSLTMKDSKVRNDYQKMYIRWIYEVLEYSLKSRLKKGELYKEMTELVFASLNRQLKYAYEKEDGGSIESILYLVKSSFEEKYHFNKNEIIDHVAEYKDALIFGFTARVYRDNKNKRNDFRAKILSILLKEIEASKRVQPSKLNYYLKTTIEALGISETRGLNLNWDNLSWDNSSDQLGVVSGSISTTDDIVFLLIDRLYNFFKENPDSVVIVDESISNEIITINKRLIDSLAQTDIYPYDLVDENFELLKAKVEEVFVKIKQNYDKRIDEELIKQEIKEDKLTNFFNTNVSAYLKSNLLNLLSKKVKVSVGKEKAFGYNTIYYKEQFVEKTNVHMIDEDMFGDNIARSENNKMLEKVLSRYREKITLTEIPKADVIDTIYVNSIKFSHVILWTKGYINLLDLNNNELFTPSWQVENKSDYGHNFQGKVNGTQVYSVFPFDEMSNIHESYLVLLNKDAITLEEFMPDKAQGEDLHIRKDKGTSLLLCINDLSKATDDYRSNLVVKSKGELKDEYLKKRVILEFYKGVGFVDCDLEKIKVFKIK